MLVLTFFILILTKIVVQNKVLDPLLFLAFRLLLVSHSNRKVGIGRKFQRPGLHRISYDQLYSGVLAHLLLVSLLGEQGKGHLGGWDVGSIVALVGRRRCLTRPRPYRECNVKYGTSIQFSGFQTLRHHLGILPFKVGIFLRVDLFLLSSDNDGFVRRFLRCRVLIIVLIKIYGQCLCHPREQVEAYLIIFIDDLSVLRIDIDIDIIVNVGHLVFC